MRAKRSLLLSCLLLISILSFGQIQISGRVLSAENNEPLPYSNVAFLKGGQLVTGTVTDLDGKFKYKLKKGEYTVYISNLGYVEYLSKKINLDKETDLGIVKLESQNVDLGEVKVTAEKSYLENKPGRTVLNVGKDIAGKGGNVSLVLKVIPSVEITPRGDISIRGNENIRVLINGKETAYGINPETLLKQLPSNTVEKIEVITGTQAKDDPSGSGGTINVILKKGTNDGFHFGANAEVGYEPFKTSLGVQTNYNKGKLNSYFNYGYYVDNFKMTYESETDYKHRRFKFQKQDGRGKYVDKGHLFMGGIDYDIKKNHRLNLELLHNRYKQDWRLNTLDNYLYTDQTTSNVKTKNKNIDKIRFTDLSLRYNGKFSDDTKIEVLTTYSTGVTKSGRNIFNDTDKEKTKSNIIDDGKYHMGTLKVDFTTKVWENGTFEAGSMSNLLTYNTTQDASGRLNFNKSYEYDQVRNAFYLSLGQKVGNFTFTAGFRPDIFWSELKEPGKKNFTHKYNSFFPSFSAAYKVDRDGVQKNYSVVFSRNILRPSYEQVDPTEDFSNPNHTYKGNPKLKPVFEDAVEMLYSYYKGKTKLNLTVFGKKSTDMIQQKTEIRDNGHLFTTFLNFSKSHSLGSEVNASLKFGKKLEVNPSALFVHHWFAKSVDGENVGNRTGIDWNFKVNNYYRFNSKNTFQFQFQYYGKNIGLYDTRKAYYQFNAGYEHKILKGMGGITFSITDLFKSGGKEYYTTKGKGFVTRSGWNIAGRSFKVALNIYLD
ncbi:hypothetical protein EMN47_02285 [Prolixibacteraceae bacterium JC049]|nr:hypothetical protein [Prolixibacteraceae bacterium JC049]